MEMTHRGADFEKIIGEAEQDLRDLLVIPRNYKVLFLQGGASMQFAMVPMNLMTKHKRAHFVHTGMWSKRAIAEAKKFGDAHIVASSEDKNFSYVPELTPEMFDQNADYVHLVSNNTIYGTRLSKLPDVNGPSDRLRYVFLHLIRENKRCRLCGYLCGRAEKYRPVGRYHRHHPGGYDR